jgi:NTP pyrophosphatase (non-canonical NTP hydrolase)
MSLDSLDYLQHEVVSWASQQFPNRSVETVTRKLVYGEIAELTIALGSGDREEIAGELADNLILLLDLAHQLKIDIASEIMKKMRVNRSRIWSENQYGVSQHIEKKE